MIERHYEAERRIEELTARLAQALSRIAKLEQDISKLWDALGSASLGGGGVGVYEVPSGVVISAGSSATADVYQMMGGSSTLAYPSATIYNEYAVATTSGKALTVGTNGDGTFTVIGQSC